jgi:RNA polymerase sigma factor (TIGR02999 family)
VPEKVRGKSGSARGLGWTHEWAAEVTAILKELERAMPAADRPRPCCTTNSASRADGDERAPTRSSPALLVHEAFVRLARPDGAGVHAGDHVHFMAIAAKVMRQVLIDHARARRAQKRSGGAGVMADGAMLDRTPHPTLATPAEPLDVLDLDGALDALAREYPRAARVVELRFFGGLSTTDVASFLGISLPTAERDWALARGWLHRRLAAEPGR